MATNSFDIVSQIDLQEVNNAVQQTKKEISTRYDLKNTGSSVEFNQNDRKLTVQAPDEYLLRQVAEVLGQKLARRGVPLKGLIWGEIHPGAGQSVTQEVELQQGIPMEKAREIVKIVKGAKLKVQSSIQGDQVRISGKNRDDLQQVIALLKEKDLGIDMQFTNYRSN